MIGKKTGKRLLDPKQCFELWNEVGSVYKVSYILRDKYGIVNPRTGRAFTPQSIFLSAGLYVTENMVEAKEIVAGVWKANGELLTDKDWYKIVIDKAKYLSKKRFKQFIDAHSYLTPYMNL